MRPLRVWAKNCRSWQELNCELPAGVTAVIGENGAGKSTLVNVVDAALFADPRELRRLLSRNANGDGTLELGCEFEHRGELYRVRRSYDPAGGGKSRLDFEREVPHVTPGTTMEPLTQETQAATQVAIEELLGLTRETFRASAFLAQGDGAAFTEAKPRERKQILSAALGLDVYDRLRELARRDLARAEAAAGAELLAAEQLEGQLELRDGLEATLRAAELNGEQARARVEDLERGLAGVQAEHADAVAATQARDAAALHARHADGALRDAEERRNGLKARAVTRAERLKAVPQLRADAEALPDLEEAADMLRRAGQAKEFYHAAVEHAHRATVERERCQREFDRVKAERQALTGTAAVCPTCGQELTLDARLQAAAGLDEQMERFAADEARADADVLNYNRRTYELEQAEKSARAAVPSGLRDEEVLAAQLAEARSAAQLLAALEEAAAEQEREDAELRVLEDRIPGLQSAKREADAAAREYDGPDPGVLRRRIDVAEADLARARVSLEKSLGACQFARAKLEAVDEAGEVAKRHRARLEDYRREAAVYRDLERAFGPNGIPALIIENAAIPAIEAEANRVVAELGRGYRFELRTERALKSREGTAESLDIVVYANGGEAAYEDFSGGERTRLDLALRLGLARLLANRRGAEVGLLAIDEPSYLDEAGFARLAVVLRGLEEEFPCILVVSHVDALRDAFDSVLAVTGGGDTGEPSALENGSDTYEERTLDE